MSHPFSYEFNASAEQDKQLLFIFRFSFILSNTLPSVLQERTCDLGCRPQIQGLKKLSISENSQRCKYEERATAFKNQITIPKATFIEIGVNQKRKTEKTKTKKKRIEGKKKGYVTGSETGAIGSTRLHLTTTTLRIIDNSVRKILNF